MGVFDFFGGGSSTESANAASELEQVVQTVGGAVSNVGQAAVNNMKEGFQQLRRTVVDDDIEEQEESSDFTHELGMFQNLSYSQRLVGFFFCIGCGAYLMVLSWLLLPTIVTSPEKFALCFTFGNVLAILSTFFLIGPRAQLEAMLDPIRAWASIAYILSLIATIVMAIFGGKLRYILVLVAIIIELIALLWYCASYIPYGRTMILKFVGVFTG